MGHDAAASISALAVFCRLQCPLVKEFTALLFLSQTLSLFLICFLSLNLLSLSLSLSVIVSFGVLWSVQQEPTFLFTIPSLSSLTLSLFNQPFSISSASGISFFPSYLLALTTFTNIDKIITRFQLVRFVFVNWSISLLLFTPSVLIFLPFFFSPTLNNFLFGAHSLPPSLCLGAFCFGPNSLLTICRLLTVFIPRKCTSRSRPTKWTDENWAKLFFDVYLAFSFLAFFRRFWARTEFCLSFYRPVFDRAEEKNIDSSNSEIAETIGPPQFNTFKGSIQFSKTFLQ